MEILKPAVMPIKIQKKLSLDKEMVSRLQVEQMAVIVGGVTQPTNTCPSKTCPSCICSCGLISCF